MAQPIVLMAGASGMIGASAIAAFDRAGPSIGWARRGLVPAAEPTP